MFVVAAFLAAVPLAGCLGQDDAGSSMTLYVKDAVTDDYVEIHATFATVQVLPAGSDRWVTVFEGNRTIELLSLSASTARERLSDLSLEDRAYDGLSIALTQVTGVTHGGETVNLTVAGDVLEIRQSFRPGADGFALLVDVDVDASTDLAAGTFTPVAANVQSSQIDSDGDGSPDLEDADDDNDGIEDAEDDDINGDNQTDRPAQAVRGHFGLCTAWYASGNARQQSNNTTNSSAFERLDENVTAANQTLDDYCAEQSPPGPPASVPEQAYAAWENAMERRAQAQEQRSAAGDQRGDPRGNQTGPGNQTGGGNQGGSGGSPGNPGNPNNDGNANGPGNRP